MDDTSTVTGKPPSCAGSVVANHAPEAGVTHVTTPGAGTAPGVAVVPPNRHNTRPSAAGATKLATVSVTTVPPHVGPEHGDSVSTSSGCVMATTTPSDVKSWPLLATSTVYAPSGPGGTWHCSSCGDTYRAVTSTGAGVSSSTRLTTNGECSNRHVNAPVLRKLEPVRVSNAVSFSGTCSADAAATTASNTYSNCRRLAVKSSPFTVTSTATDKPYGCAAPSSTGAAGDVHATVPGVRYCAGTTTSRNRQASVGTSRAWDTATTTAVPPDTGPDGGVTENAAKSGVYSYRCGSALL